MARTNCDRDAEGVETRVERVRAGEGWEEEGAFEMISPSWA
jgi:hypothetical protein